MRFLALFAMLVACLVYGYMPARAAMPVQAIEVTASDVHAGHHEQKSGAADDPCPHRGGPVHGSFCAACLAIVPVAETARAGHPPFSWPQPGPARELAACRPAPAEPPPRA